MSQTIFIGVDGGGTGCRARIATANRVLGEGRGGPANVSSDQVGAIRNVTAAIAQAMADAEMDSLDRAHAHLGLAGVLSPAQAEAVAQDMPFETVTVTDDRPTMLAGALGSDDGIVAAIGTGSFVGSKRGSEYRFVGGWGFMLSDEASGAWLGRAVLAETLQACDGMRKKTDLTQQIMDHFDNDASALSEFARTAPPADFGAFAPMVTAAAEGRDDTGLALMQRGAGYIETALQTLDFQPTDVLCLTGGLGPIYEGYLPNAFTDRLREPNGTALDGALILARAMV